MQAAKLLQNSRSSRSANAIGAPTSDGLDQRHPKPPLIQWPQGYRNPIGHTRVILPHTCWEPAMANEFDRELERLRSARQASSSPSRIGSDDQLSSLQKEI